MIGPPSATVYLFRGVGLTLEFRSVGNLGGGRSFKGEVDVVLGRPDVRLPYEETEDDKLEAVLVFLGNPGILSGLVDESDEGGELAGDTKDPRSTAPESGGVA